MSIEPALSAEQLAELFYRYRELLNAGSECRRGEPAPLWEQAAESERKLLIAAARVLLSELARKDRQRDSYPEARLGKYFATPGEAEWGC